MAWMTWPVVIVIAAVAAVIIIVTALARQQHATEEVRDELRKQAGTYHPTAKERREARQYARLHNQPDPYPDPPRRVRKPTTKAQRDAVRYARLHNLPDPTDVPTSQPPEERTEGEGVPDWDGP